MLGDMNGTGTAVVLKLACFLVQPFGHVGFLSREPLVLHRCQEDETKDAKAIEQEQILALMVACPGSAPNPSLCGSMGKFTNGMFTY